MSPSGSSIGYEPRLIKRKLQSPFSLPLCGHVKKKKKLILNNNKKNYLTNKAKSRDSIPIKE
jgi:hypothetical protein